MNELVKLHLAAVVMLLKQSAMHPLWSARPHHTVALCKQQGRLKRLTSIDKLRH